MRQRGTRAIAAAIAMACGLAALPAHAQEDKLLNVYNWSDYIAKDTVAKFEAETGIKVNYDVYDGNEVLEATVSAYRELLLPAIRNMRDPKSARATQKVHEELVEAVRRRDPDGARQIMLTHLADFEKRLRRWLSTQAEDLPPASVVARIVRSNDGARARR